MAEGARLESVCTGNRTEGSNPSLSAMFSDPGLRWREGILQWKGEPVTQARKRDRTFQTLFESLSYSRQGLTLSDQV